MNLMRTPGDKPATQAAGSEEGSGWRPLPTLSSTPTDDHNGFDGHTKSDGVTPMVVVLEEGHGLGISPRIPVLYNVGR